MRRLLVTALMTLTLAAAGPALAQGTCAKAVTGAELARYISKADVAFSQMDAEAFRAARWQADSSIPCLGAAVQVGQAAAFYRMQALGAFMDQEHAKTVGWFKSVFAVAPRYVLPQSLAPNGHPLRIDYEVAQDAPEVGGEPVPRPAVGLIRVDGKIANELPRDRPYLWQHADGDGRSRTSAVVVPGMRPPRYATTRGQQEVGPPREGVTKVRRESGLSKPLAVIAGVSAIASGVSYGMSSSKAQKFWDASTPQGKLGGLRDQTNTWAWVSVGTGSLAIGCGTAAVISGTW
jgi:hypothetical protein